MANPGEPSACESRNDDEDAPGGDPIETAWRSRSLPPANPPPWLPPDPNQPIVARAPEPEAAEPPPPEPPPPAPSAPATPPAVSEPDLPVAASPFEELRERFAAAPTWVRGSFFASLVVGATTIGFLLARALFG